MNFILPLNETYEVLFSRYRENIQRNVKRAMQLNCTLKKGFPIDEVILIAREQFKLFTTLSENDFARLKKLYTLLHSRQKAVTYGICSKEGQLVSSAAFFISGSRAYYILVGNHPNGKTLGASHALMDAFIKDHAGQNLVLDFEGSDVPNLALFYSGFGAIEEKFAGIKLNRLPKLVKLLKR